MPADGPSSQRDEIHACLARLAVASEELRHRISEFSQRASGSARGDRSPAYPLPLEKRLAVIEQISAAVRELAREGNRFRRLQAHALYAEGLTMAELAAIFGVSRQRVGALLHDDVDGPAEQVQRARLAVPAGAPAPSPAPLSGELTA